jgi:hypothetical protein
MPVIRISFEATPRAAATGTWSVVGEVRDAGHAVMADAVEAAGQHVDEEAADELAGGERHGLVALAAVGAVVLPLERDAAFIAGDEPAVGDGDPVGVAGEISQHGLRAGERTLGVDHPLGLAQRPSPSA